LKPKALPSDYSFDSLFAPNASWAYLRDAEHFQPSPGIAFDAANAWWFAELCMLCYVSEPEYIRTELARAGLRDVALLHGRGIHCILAGDWVIFRGSADVNDALKDLDAVLVQEGDARIHRGFQAALDEIWEALLPHIQGRKPIFAGHSLGGAMAVIAGSRHPHTRCAYTFGAPRIGDAEFMDSILFPVHRVVNNNDIVTRLPPPIFYCHVGSLKYFDSDGQLHDEPGLWKRVREQIAGHADQLEVNVGHWLAGDFKSLPYASLVDHSPVHYAIRAWNHLVRESERERSE
jgi:triacylglycerol lipase